MSNDTYEVGYGRPPESGKFKKGQSGNYGGRPKGAKGAKTIMKQIQDILSETISVKIDGEKVRITYLEAIARQLVTAAVNGDAKARRDLLNLIGGATAVEDNAESNPALDIDLLNDFLRRRSELASAPADKPVLAPEDLLDDSNDEDQQ